MVEYRYSRSRLLSPLPRLAPSSALSSSSLHAFSSLAARSVRLAMAAFGRPVHRRLRWFRRHFRIGDNRARPTWVPCKATFTKSTAGEGSGCISSLRMTKVPSPRSTSHSAASLTRSCHEAASSAAAALTYWSCQSGRMAFGTLRVRLASCLKSAGCL
jgi:hypothetical protein